MPAVYLAAVLEYLVAEILEHAGNAARDNKASSRSTERQRHLIVLYTETTYCPSPPGARHPKRRRVSIPWLLCGPCLEHGHRLNQLLSDIVISQGGNIVPTPFEAPSTDLDDTQTSLHWDPVDGSVASATSTPTSFTPPNVNYNWLYTGHIMIAKWPGCTSLLESRPWNIMCDYQLTCLSWIIWNKSSWYVHDHCVVWMLMDCHQCWIMLV